MLTSAMVFPWIGLLALVGTAQHFAANEWEKLLWRQRVADWGRYLKVGFYWGGCGIGLFSLMVILAVDPNLLTWMAATGLLVLYLAAAIVSAAFVAWCTVEQYDSLWARVVALLSVALMLTYSYPTLKYFQEGVWLTYPEHTLGLALYLLSFAAVFRLSVLSLGFRNLTSSTQKRDLRWWVRHPRFIYAIACLALDVLWMLVLVDLMRLYPIEFRSVRPGESNLDFAFGYTQSNDMAAVALGVVIAVLLINVFTRHLSFKVQDVLAWNTANHVLPMNHSLALENTALVKKALGLANVAVVTWHAPRSLRGLGTDDLRTGTTYISSGPLHDAGLAAMGENINLPDFWKAIIHPEDYPGAVEGVGKALSGEVKGFEGQSRFKATDGSWLTIRGQVEVERSPVNGLPVSIYGIHSNITEQVQENELLGATKTRQLNALRMIGHDLRGALGTVMMSGAMIERFMQKHGTIDVVDKNVARINNAANKALDFLTDAVTYARTEDRNAMGEPVDVNVYALIEEIVSKETTRYGVERAKVVLSCASHATVANVLQFPLTSILTNLISNGIKYTPDASGRVRITVKSLGAKTAGVQGRTLIEVADDGVGIPPAFIQRLFTAFSRADNVGDIEGFGLGMAIVANALELLDAEIDVVSVPQVERGTVFTLILPNALTLADSEIRKAQPV